MLLDVGNSRLKWAVLPLRTAHARAHPDQQPFQDRGIIPATELRRSGAALESALRSAGRDARIYVCSVAGPQIVRRLRSSAAATGLRSPRFVHSAVSAAGVRNGYAEVWRLGVDRWVALIGAHHQYPGRDLCIVGVGSALTIDVLSADGRHRGRLHHPGPQMMIQALLQNTAGIRRRAGLRSAAELRRALSASVSSRALPRELFARDTRSGVLAGCRYACAGLIDRAVHEARTRFGRRLGLILTGGGAALIAPLLQGKYRGDEDLVLRGLAVLATSAPAGPDRWPTRGRKRSVRIT